MRRPLSAAAIVVALGLAAAQAPFAQGQVTHQPQDKTPPQDATPSAANENQKANQSLSNPPQSGRTEPSATNAASANQGSDGASHAQSSPVFVNGVLDVPGAPSDSQTRPAKFSQHNDEIDKQPIMAMRLARLDDAQRRAIMDAVGKVNAPVASTQAKASEELPMGVALNELPQAATGAADLRGLKYVQLADGILLIDAPNRVVVGEIKK
jgi:hypothetical protein